MRKLIILVLLIGLSFAQKPTTRPVASTDWMQLTDIRGNVWDYQLSQVFGSDIATDFDLVIEFRDKIQAVINEYSVKFAESHTSKPDVQINTSKIVWRIGKYNKNRIAGPLDKK